MGGVTGHTAVVLVKHLFKLFRFIRLLLERLLGRVQDSLTKVKRITKVRPGPSSNNLLLDVLDERYLSGSLIPLT